jgi:uncharacterized membrane protein YqhA
MTEPIRQPSNKIEHIFELLLWKSRLVVLLAVIFSIMGSFALFVIGSVEIFSTVTHQTLTEHAHNSGPLLAGVIGAIDLYLIAIVLLIFSFGIYELFVSKLDIAHLHKDIQILEINSLDELKNKILKVIIMVLIVFFFKSTLSTQIHNPLEMLYFALSILAIAAGAFLIRNIDSEK